MRRFPGLILLLAAAFLISGSLQGQEKVKGVLPANWGKLGLSDEQKQKVYKVQGEYKEKIADLKKQVADLEAASPAARRRAYLAPARPARAEPPEGEPPAPGPAGP